MDEIKRLKKKLAKSEVNKTDCEGFEELLDELEELRQAAKAISDSIGWRRRR